MTNKTQIRTRFAPSPTGFQHIGGLRTAFYAALVANNAKLKGLDGSFILRIEDTDQERSHPTYESNIFKSLKWANVNWDEGPDIGGPNAPYIQSERLDSYQKYAKIIPWLERIEPGAKLIKSA